MTSETKLLSDAVGITLVGERLEFADSVHVGRSGRRTVGAMTELFDAADPADESVLYDTFVDVYEEADHDAFPAGKLGFNLTSIRSAPVGDESPKTHGHVHSPKPDGWPPAEVYEVLHGSAVFLLQDLHAGPESRVAYAVHAEVGDVLVIPGAMFHSSINVGPDRLVFGDLCRRGMSDVYQDIRDAHGFSYLHSAAGGMRPNPAYSSVPELVHMSTEEWARRKIGPIYRTLRDDPVSLSWLWDRDEFIREFPHLAQWAYPSGLGVV